MVTVAQAQEKSEKPPVGARNRRFDKVNSFINNPHQSLPAASRDSCGSLRKLCKNSTFLRENNDLKVL